MKTRFSIVAGRCLKVPNSLGEVLSLGGDDNLRGDDVLDRLSVVFFDANDNRIYPAWLSEDERDELMRNKELSVWGCPEIFASLLQRHMEER